MNVDSDPFDTGASFVELYFGVNMVGFSYDFDTALGDFESSVRAAAKFLNFDAKAAGEKRLLQLNELDEFRRTAYENAKVYKERNKKWYDRKIASRAFEPSQKVLLFNSRQKLFPGKLKSRWLGPFVVTRVSPYGHVELEDRNSDNRFIVNGQRVKHYLKDEIDRQRFTHLLT
ncbi:uncharacterized protein LOC130976659 [Arachis stenosperma]|uniref:uncharacterized protein LOC130976659 n=1 Tax=Arachis stenosperma TaxID=217475 RepID=UPI0025AC76A9|nr:uncharacterized protein LOC130976659 [Arachis stenosperma]